MSKWICGYQWANADSLHQQHVCGEETDGSDHVHECASCRVTQ